MHGKSKEQKMKGWGERGEENASGNEGVIFICSLARVTRLFGANEVHTFQLPLQIVSETQPSPVTQ